MATSLTLLQVSTNHTADIVLPVNTIITLQANIMTTPTIMMITIIHIRALKIHILIITSIPTTTLQVITIRLIMTEAQNF